jgi:multiple sugar transport system permease protein
MASESLDNWIDRNSARLFLLPTVLLILGFSLFPLIISAWLSLSRFKLSAGGYDIRYIGWLNFKKLFTGSQQFHFLGTFAPIGPVGWVIIGLVAALLIWGIYSFFTSGRVTLIGFIGRCIAFPVLAWLAWLVASTTGEGGRLGSLSTTLFYVFVGVSLQFFIGTLLAWLCAQNIKGRSFFRLVFFIPLMVTPVGIAYTFRMMADMSVGPFSPIWKFFGLGEFSWAADPWTARLVVVIGDSWQWIPFIFIVMLAAFESQSRDEIEAAELDGASGWLIFKDITWPSVVPVACTVVLIRIIEAFKIVDLPNVLTNGGPGIATESLTLHSFIEWRALNLGGSASVAYMLLVVSTIICVSYFQLVVLPMRRARE